jgi:hypothetical protein
MHNNNNTTTTTTTAHLPSEGVIEETSYDEDNKSLPDETQLTPLEKHISTLQNETEMNIALSNLLHINKPQLHKQRINTLYQSYIFLKDRKEDIKTLLTYYTLQHTTTTLTLDDYVNKLNTTKSELKWVRKEQNENMNHKQQLMSDNLGGLACNYFTERFACGANNNFDSISVCSKSTRNDVFAHSRCTSTMSVANSNNNASDELKLKHLKEKLTQLEHTLLNKKKTYPMLKERYEKYKKDYKLLIEKYKQKQLILENMEDEVVKLKEIVDNKEKEKPQQEKKKSFLKKLFH